MATYTIDLFPIGTRVMVRAMPNWIEQRVKHMYCHIQLGMEGTVIGYTMAGDKIAVQFDDYIWGIKSTIKVLRCMYLSPNHLNQVTEFHFDPDLYLLGNTTDDLLILY